MSPIQGISRKMPFRSDREALQQRVSLLEEDIAEREAELSGLRRRSGAPRKRTWLVAGATAGVLAGSIAVWLSTRTERPHNPAPPWSRGGVVSTPVIRDLDGDGVGDLVAAFGQEDVTIAAIDGRSGALRWRTPASRGTPHLGVTEDGVVLAQGHTVTAYRPDGSVASTFAVPEPVAELCVCDEGLERGSLWLRGERDHTLINADGERGVANRPAWCEPAGVGPAPAIGGIAATEMVGSRDGLVALGRHGASNVLVGFRFGDEQARWKTRIRSRESLRAGRNALHHRGSVYVADADRRTLRVARIDALSGERRWHAELDTLAPQVRAVVAGDGRLAVVHGDRISWLETDHGVQVATFGR